MEFGNSRVFSFSTVTTESICNGLGNKSLELYQTWTVLLEVVERGNILTKDII